MTDSTETNRWYGSVVVWFLKSAVVAGVAGGLVFALVSPFALPAITNWQSDTGHLVDQPNVRAEFSGGPTEFEIKNNVTYPVQNQTYNYTVSVENTNNRLAEDVRLTFYFKGCAENRKFSEENGQLYADPGIKLDSTRCSETVYIPDLPKDDPIRLRYHIRSTAPKKHPNHLIAIDPDAFMAYRVEYQWSLNGMTFHEEHIKQVNESEML